QLDAAYAGGARPPPGLRARQAHTTLSKKPQDLGVSAPVPRRHIALLCECRPQPASGRARSIAICRTRSCRAQCWIGVSADRRADVPAHLAALWLLLVRTGDGERSADLAHPSSRD